MQSTSTALNPFSLMMEPESVLQAMERSKTLRGLKRHTLRPLDRPLIPFKTTPVDVQRKSKPDSDSHLDD